MRLGSSCLSWELSRCSSYSSDQTTSDCAELRSSSISSTTLTTTSSFKQYGPTRQWSNKCANNNYNASSVTKDSLKAQCGSQFSSQSSTDSLQSSLDGLKTLPSRPKSSQRAPGNSCARLSVEENRQLDVRRSRSDTATYVPVKLDQPAPAIEVNVARSRCHPRRRQCPDSQLATVPKLRRDTDCTEAIVRLIVFFSTKLVHTIWSQASATPKMSKDFNGAGVLPLQVFIQETLRRSKTSYSTLQVALFYLILLRPHVRPCQGAQQNTSSCRALQCGRRMFLTALILASKYLQDRNYSARAWSKISGLPVAEINENERHYLELIKYNLHVSKETFEHWSKVVLTICKASGQGPFGNRQQSPPSSPDSLAYVSDREQPGSLEWWSYHLTRLTPDMIRNSQETEQYLAGLSQGFVNMDSTISLETPPSSPESLEGLMSSHSSPLVLPSVGPGQVPTSELAQSPASVGPMPTRPLPPNLPTPQTTPRCDSAFLFSRKSSQADLRCRASLQALGVVDKQSLTQANLETCPPPKPRHCESAFASMTSNITKDMSDTASSAWTSSPEGSYSDASSFTTRSRSSSISSVSSVWSAVGANVRPVEAKQSSSLRSDTMVPQNMAQPHGRSNVGTYSFYHPVASTHAIPENSKVKVGGPTFAVQTSQANVDATCSIAPIVSNDLNDLSDTQVAHLLASLSSQSDGQVQHRADPAAVSLQDYAASTRVDIGPGKKHKRSRSSKEENVLHDEVRRFLWDNPVSVSVEDDKRPTTYVETADKEAQYPLQTWAHAKKPVCNAMHTKRIALQHARSSGESNASGMATDFLRQSVSVT